MAVNIVDHSTRSGGPYDVYLQDEWRILPVLPIRHFDPMDFRAPKLRFLPLAAVVRLILYSCAKSFSLF
ncbi:MAG: hypothetical protein ACT4O2_14565 [Beijerinckiaceae bacterium]